MVEQPEWATEAAEPIIAKWADRPGGLLPMLIEIQDEFGYIDDAVIPGVAEALNLSKAEVVGVVNFYHDFRKQPGGRHTLKVCLAEACQAMGSAALVTHIEARLGAGPGEMTTDSAFSIEPVYCLGNCGLSPAVMIDGRVYGRVTPRRADSLLAGIQ